MSEENAAATARNLAAVRLPPFWPKSPLAWFRVAEAQFVIRNIEEPLDHYYLVLAALAEPQIDRVRAIVEAEPAAASYDQLHAALISKHTLMPYQQVDMLVSMEPLGGRKPSDMLAEMEKFKPKDMQSFYAHHFLQRLPREIRVLLAQDDVSNMAALAEKADQPQHRSRRWRRRNSRRQSTQRKKTLWPPLAGKGTKASAARRRAASSAAAALLHQRSGSPPCAGHTSGMATRPTTARSRAPGWETNRPGRRCICRPRLLIISIFSSSHLRPGIELSSTNAAERRGGVEHSSTPAAGESKTVIFFSSSHLWPGVELSSADTTERCGGVEHSSTPAAGESRAVIFSQERGDRREAVSGHRVFVQHSTSQVCKEATRPGLEGRQRPLN
jgi:hypothetical protein